MASRKIIVPIDSILELFKSYTSETGDIPMDARPTGLMVKPTEKGMFAIRAVSEDWSAGLPPLQVHFDIRRMFGNA